jgi:hypothetical protein
MSKKSRLLLAFLLTIIPLVATSALAKEKKVKKLKVPDAKVVFCEELSMPEGGGVCNISTGDNALLIKGNILVMDTIYQGGEVLVDQSGLITYVGCSSSRPDELASLVAGATSIECAEGVVSPGLINAHDHLTYNHNYPSPASDTRYDHRNDWRENTPNNWNTSSDSSQAKVFWSELRQAMAGTTSIAAGGSEVGLLRNLDPPY